MKLDALDIYPDWAPHVAAGSQSQAIIRIRPIAVGDRLIFTCRRKSGRILGSAIVSKIQAIRIDMVEFKETPRKMEFRLGVNVSGSDLPALQIERLAFNTGFRTGGAPNLIAFVRFFRTWAGLDLGKPFEGVILYWAGFVGGNPGLLCGR